MIIFIITLVTIYALLIFVIVALEELQDPKDFAKSQFVL